MLQKHSSRAGSPPPPVHTTLREGVELVLDGEVFVVRLNSVHARMAVRAFAYSVCGEDAATAKALLEWVGREG